ncbi:MAG: ATP-binding protein [Victivallales bacterium]|nr:ATP-binding protein [Victivallales bacterium]
MGDTLSFFPNLATTHFYPCDSAHGFFVSPPRNPCSFAEYHSCIQGDRLDEWNDYLTYGGMPLVVLERNEARRRTYLNSLYEEVYLKDLVERNDIRDIPLLENLLDVLSSSVGSPTNPTRLANALNSANRQKDTTANTVEQYIRHLMQAYLSASPSGMT